MTTIATWNTISLVCPYCLELINDDTEFIDVRKRALCPHCNNNFEFKKIQFERYMSYKIHCQDCTFKIMKRPRFENPYIRENICFTVYTCSKCGRSDIATAPAEPGDAPFIVSRDL